jgi:hypothetical protein
MKKSKQNMVIQSDLESFKSEQDDVTKNLFKICCAIVNLQVNQRGQNFLDDKLLYTYLDAINFNRDDEELIYIDQLACIKSLINRKAYSLTDKQCKLIHQKFNNMSENRLKSLFLQEKELLKGDRIFRDKDQFPEPVPRLPIKETLREPFTPKQEIMTERPR